MAAPTQQYPSWLSVSTSIMTDVNGDPTATSTTVINLPLTYYGPSIPLGTDGSWVYGGLTSPSESPSATMSPPTPSATPSTASTTPSTTSAIPSSITTSPVSSSTAQSSSVPISSGTSSSTTTPTAVSGNSSAHRRTIIGAVLGSVLGSILLLFLVILCLRIRSRRRNAAGSPGTEDGVRRDHPLWMWEMVDDTQAEPVEEQREPGEGSPRGSGDEHESFLRRSQSATDGMREREPSARLINEAAVGVAVAGASGQDNSRSTKGSGEKTDGSSQYATGESAGSHPSPGARHILPRDVLLRMYPDEEPTPGHTLTPHDEEHEARADSPLLPPPAINPDPLVISSSRKQSTQSLLSEGSVTPGGDPEKATVQTARRVRVGDLPPRLPDRLTTVEDESPRDEANPSSATWLGGSFAKLARFSFLNRPPPSPQSRSPSRGVSRPSSLVVHGLSDADVEAARAGLRPEMGYRDDPRPISTVSGKSAVSSTGGTIYHDASSRPATPGTPGGVGSNSSAARGPSRLVVSHGPEPSVSDADPAPPAYEAQASPSSSYSGGRALALDLGPGFADILDLPAPPPEVPFAASRKGATVVPPGLTSMPNPSVWRNSGAGSPLSPNSFITAGSNTSGSTAGIMIDVLEEAPPAAGEGWRSLSRGVMDDSQGRRTTFGQPPVYVHPRDVTLSHAGSLHSMRSHLSPRAAYSPTGSAPASSRRTESGSGSSHPSGHSRGGSSGVSLAHSGSISSDGRRRLHRVPPGEVSPPISAVGRSSVVPSPVPPPASTHSATVTSTATGGTGSSVTTHTSVTDPVTGETMRFPTVPWTGGLDGGEDRPERGSFGGSWGNPSHLRALQSRLDQDHTSHT